MAVAFSIRPMTVTFGSKHFGIVRAFHLKIGTAAFPRASLFSQRHPVIYKHPLDIFESLTPPVLQDYPGTALLALEGEFLNIKEICL